MEFNFRGWDEQMQHMYHTPVKERLWNGTSHGGVPGSVDIREVIHRELEKERIREEIVAEEIARKRILEAEVRREMAMEMAMHGPSSFMLKPPQALSHTNRLEPGMPRAQPFAPVPLQEKYGGSQRQHREIGAFQRLPSSTGDGKNKVIDLGKPNGVTQSGAKGKSASAGSTSEWSCAVCKVSAPCEDAFNQHLAGKKHQAQMAALGLKTSQKQSLSSSTSVNGKMKLKNKSAVIGLGVAPKKSTTMGSNVLKSNKSATNNSSKCVLIDSKKEDKKSGKCVSIDSKKEDKKNGKCVLIDSKKEDKKSGKCVSIDSKKEDKKNGKCVSIDSKKEDKKSGTRQQFLFSCEMCNVGASSDKVMNAHIKGKKHLQNLLKLHQESTAPGTKKKLETVGGLEKVIGDEDKESMENTHIADSESIGSIQSI